MKKVASYLKEILKTTVKVAAIGAVTYLAAPFALGFVATMLNAMVAGEVAAAAVMGVGAYTAFKVASKDILTMSERIEKKEREEHVDEQLTDLKKELKKVQPKKATHTEEKEVEPKTVQKRIQPKKKGKWKINPFLRKRAREYERAA